MTDRPERDPMTTEAFAAKISWEGGIPDAFDYGLKPLPPRARPGLVVNQMPDPLTPADLTRIDTDLAIPPGKPDWPELAMRALTQGRRLRAEVDRLIAARARLLATTALYRTILDEIRDEAGAAPDSDTCAPYIAALIDATGHPHATGGLITGPVHVVGETGCTLTQPATANTGDDR